jgi:hypothetical protein
MGCGEQGGEFMVYFLLCASLAKAVGFMESAITLVILPVVVAVFALIFEYWVIQPIKERTQNYNTSARRSPNNSLSTSKWPLATLLPTGVLVFLFTIALVFSQLQIPDFVIGEIVIPVPEIVIPEGSLLSNVNITLAAIIYVCLALNVVTYHRGPRWANFFTIRILPPFLITLWNVAFFQGNFLAFTFFLVVVNLYVLLPLYDNGYVSYQTTTTVIALFPTNALLIIAAHVTDHDFWSWALAGLILFFSFAILGSTPAEVNTSMNSENEYVDDDNR